MTKQQIIDYVMDSPSNTNPAILGQMIDEVNQSGENEEYPIITATWHEDEQYYDFSCNWTFTKLKTKIQTSASDSNSWAGIMIDTSGDGSVGGTWSNSDNMLLFFRPDNWNLKYFSDGVIIADDGGR